MSGWSRLGRVLGVVLLVILLVTAIAFSQGAVWISIHEKKPDGTHLSLLLPAAPLPLLVRLMPAEDRERAAAQLRPWAPTLQAASRALADADDGVLVEVKSPTEHVLVRKQGRSLLLLVDSPEENVRLAFPLRLVDEVSAEIVAASPLS